METYGEIISIRFDKWWKLELPKVGKIKRFAFLMGYLPVGEMATDAKVEGYSVLIKMKNNDPSAPARRAFLCTEEFFHESGYSEFNFESFGPFETHWFNDGYVYVARRPGNTVSSTLDKRVATRKKDS